MEPFSRNCRNDPEVSAEVEFDYIPEKLLIAETPAIEKAARVVEPCNT